MRTGWILVIAAALALIGGCKTAKDGQDKTAEVKTAARDKSRVFLTVDFQQGQTLRYRFLSKRTITLDWDPNAVATKNRVQKHDERMEMTIAYTPVEVDPYGVSTVRATVESLQAIRSGGVTGRTFGTDAVESAKGRSFVVKVDPRGRIVDASELKDLIQEMGEKAFREGAGGARVKDPDMVGDFVACTWFLWDGVATIPLPAEGLAIGQTWPSQLPTPSPMVMRKARDVTYRFNGIRSGPRGAAGVIESTYKLAASTPEDWPVPYAGRFRMSGTFGFLGPYEALSLEGSGEELYNIQAGRLEQRQQQYTMQVKASLPPMGVEVHPHITIEQVLTAELLLPELQTETRNPNVEILNKSK
ncbi:MAG: hypothetical protein ACM3VT_00620 [Solirubrobacterales bacterium]